ncbi:MAG: hypothetical protein KKB74_10955 [Bacteroidetes bacterium]|nr:hypothetical protein [Bacteroidota bacterium]
MKAIRLIASLIILLTFAQQINAQCINCENTTTNELNSSAIGKGTEATGSASFASGAFSIASGDGSTSIGFRNLSSNIYTTTLGSFLKATVSHAMVIGDGYGLDNELINDNAYSLMIGFNSTKPTLFISTSDGYLKTGKVGIGNITSPISKLHIKADDGEVASIFIEPNNWSLGENSMLMLGNAEHSISADLTSGMKFSSQSNFVFNGTNFGIGIEQPKAKLHINGDLMFEHDINGIIMKSEDGNCWKGQINNNGELIFTQVDCNNVSSVENLENSNDSQIFIYPNPSNGDLTIEYTGNQNELRIEISTVNGLIMGTYKIKQGENKIRLINPSAQMIIVSAFSLDGKVISTKKIIITN